MQTPPYAKVLVAKNGAPVGSGGLTVAAGDVIQLSAEMTAGWRSQRWELTDTPPGFAMPSGWLAATGGGFYSIAPTPPPFTMPAVAGTTWGKYAVRLRVNGNPLLLNPDGSRSTSFRSTLTDEGTILSLPSTGGLRGVALGENLQFDPQRAWLGPLMADMRVLEAGGGGGGGGTTLPAAGAPNAVAQVSTTGVVTVAPLSWDQILPAWSINTFATSSPTQVDIGQAVAVPAFTASYSSTPTSAILTDNAGTAAKDVTSTPTSFASSGSFTKSTDGASVTFTLSAHSATSPTKAASVTITWLPRNRWGVGAAGQTSAAFILGLAGSALATSAASGSGMTLAPTTSQKSYFACRSTFTPHFQFVGNFPGGFTKTASAVSVTVNSVAETYDLYEADNLGAGGVLLVT
jgi:hypothetical protein